MSGYEQVSKYDLADPGRLYQPHLPTLPLPVIVYYSGSVIFTIR